MSSEVIVLKEINHSRTVTEHVSDILFFFYVLGLTSFKSAAGFDYFFCRASYIVLVSYEFIVLMFEHKKGKNAIIKWYMPFIAFYFISMIWGNYEDGIYYVNNFIQIFGVILFYFFHINKKSDIIRYYKIIAYTLFLSCFIIYFRSSFYELGSARIGREELSLNANSVGIRFAFGAIICLFLAQSNVLYYVLFGCLTFYSLFSGSKTAFSMLLTGCVIFLSFKDVGFKTFINIFLILCFLALLFYLVMFVDEFYSVIGHRLQVMWNSMMGEATILNGNIRYDTSLEERSFYFRYAIKMFFDSWLWGYGANSFVTEMKHISYWHVAYSHNNYTEVLSTLGIVGGFLFFAPQVKTLLDRGKRLFKVHNPYNAFCFSVIVCFIIIQWGTVLYMSPIDYLIIIPIIMSSLDKNIDCEKQAAQTACEGLTCEETNNTA